jgi:hypothetical protein
MMFRPFLTVLFFVLFLSFSTLCADISPVTSEDDMTPERVRLDFRAQQAGIDGSDLFDKWGIRLSTDGDGEISVQSISFGLIGKEILFAAHDSPVAGQGLAVNFLEPVQKVAFNLRGAADVVVTMTAFDANGDTLGSVQHDGLDSKNAVFAGFSTDDPRGVSKVVLAYSGSDEVEKIEDLFFTYAERPKFRTYLAQIADGKIGANALKTTIVIANLANTTTSAEIKIIGDDGAPLELELEGDQVVSELGVQLESLASSSLVTAGSASPPVQGYICIESDAPIEGTAIFQLVDGDGLPLSEAGVGSSTGRYNMVGAVTKEAGKQFDSGVAVINVGDAPASGVIQLIRSDGLVEGQNAGFLSLAEGQHDAAFLDQLFPSLFGEDFDGTLAIRSDQRLVVVILRTVRGLVLSSLPVGSTQR